MATSDYYSTAWISWTTTTSSTGIDDSIWYAWNSSSTTDTVSLSLEDTTNVWGVWTQHFTIITQFYDSQQSERKEEKERAEVLLQEHLNEEQKADLAAKNEFEVVGQSGKHYKIKRGVAGNVYSLDKKRKEIAKHCIHPIDDVPEGDAMLAQMIWLKWNEEEFHRVANTTKLRAA